MRAMGREEVLEAKISSGFPSASTSASTLCLRARSSNTASITSPTDARPSRSAATVRWLCAVAAASTVMRPFSTARAQKAAAAARAASATSTLAS